MLSNLSNLSNPSVTAQFVSATWTFPFIGLLLSIALMPLTVPMFWHRHFGKVAAFWALAFILPFGVIYGVGAASERLIHTFIAEYSPFILLLTALYTVAGGICIRMHLRATPLINTALLALGTVLASIMGTTGAAMLLIRPLLRANHARRYTAHVVVFFIFLVANIGGALTPLGDPPLFLGFLNGVGFFWTTMHLIGPLCVATTILLALFYALDRYYFYRDKEKEEKEEKENSASADRIDTRVDTTNIANTAHTAHSLGLPAQTVWVLSRKAEPSARPRFAKPSISIEGKINFLLLGSILVAVLLSGLYQSQSNDQYQLNIQLLRDGWLIAVTLISLRLTPKSARVGNGFNWMPLKEVAKLFASIFLTITPVIELLRARDTGASALGGWMTQALNDAQGRPIDAMYFWATGLLSSCLDNAPTYLVFFNLAGGDAARLMHSGAITLTAISAGAVFMGANTYLGNAPNLMVRTMAASHGVSMPSFFGYMIWSAVILIPVFALITLIFFNP